jgi:hypothetical protein
MYVCAEYDFTSKNENELSITKGETLKVLNERSGWYFGQNSKQKEGFFPMEYTSPKKLSEPVAKSIIQNSLIQTIQKKKFKSFDFSI